MQIKSNKPLFFKELIDFISGDKFDESLMLKIKKIENITRLEKLINISKNKKIIHVGCVDHLEILDQKIKNNEWLHSKLENSATKCIGIDINKKGIDHLKKLGYKNVFYCDLTEPNLDEITKNKFDYMLLGEIIEHVDNPQNFLSKINKIYKENVDKIVITTPNAFSYQNFRNNKKSFEMINSDHKTLFSAYTLLKTLYLSGFEIEEIFFVDPTYNFMHRVLNKILNKKIISNNYTFSSTLLITASFLRKNLN